MSVNLEQWEASGAGVVQNASDWFKILFQLDILSFSLNGIAMILQNAGSITLNSQTTREDLIPYSLGVPRYDSIHIALKLLGGSGPWKLGLYNEEMGDPDYALPRQEGSIQHVPPFLFESAYS